MEQASPQARRRSPAEGADTEPPAACPLCGGESGGPYLPALPGVLVCADCSAVFRAGPSETAAGEALYQKDYYLQTWAGSLGRFFHEFDPQAHRKTRFFMAQLDRLNRLGAGRELLDVGSANGVFVRLAEQAGFQAMGIDVSGFAVEWGRRQFGVRLETAAIEALEGEARFDVITFWDTLEHLADPGRALRAAFRLLQPGGRVVVLTPDRGSLVNRLVDGLHVLSFGRSVRVTRRLYHDDHLFFFDRPGLARLLEGAGLVVELSEGYDEAPEDTETGGLMRWAVALVAALARRLGREHEMLVLARKR